MATLKHYPLTAERNYMRKLIAYMRDIHGETMRRIKEQDILRNDAWSDDVSTMMAGLAIYSTVTESATFAYLPGAFAAVNRYNDQQWILQVRAGTGITLPPSGAVPSGMIPYANISAPSEIRARFGVGVDVFRSEPWLSPLQDNWIAENVRLIKTIPDRYFGEVEGIIRRGTTQGLSSKEMIKEISVRYDVSKNRAKIIARDQTSKANAALAERRQADLGVEQYVWESSDDERVRPTHKKADGKTFNWDDPPSYTEGHPGHAIMCRCWARAVFDD